MKRRSNAARVAALAFLLAAPACGGSSADRGSGTTRAVVPGRVSVVHQEPRLADAVGARDQVEVRRCDTGPGPVVATGDVTNPDRSATDVSVAVRWVAPEGNRILDEAFAVIQDLAADQTATWTVEGDVPSKRKAICTYSVHRGSVR